MRYLRFDPDFKFEKQIVSTRWIDECLESENMANVPDEKLLKCFR